MTDRNNVITFDDGDALIRTNGHEVRINPASGDDVLIRIKDGEGDIRSAISEIAKSLVVTVPVPDGFEEIDPMLATVDDYFQVGDSDGGYDLCRIRSIDSDGDIYVQGIGYAWNRKTRTNRNLRLENPWRVVRRITSSNGSSAKTGRPAPIRMVTLAEAEPGDIAVWRRGGGRAVNVGVISEDEDRLVVLEGDLIQGRVGEISGKWVIRSIDGTDGGSMDWFVILRLNKASDGHKPSDFMEPTDRCIGYQTATGTRLYLDSDGDWSLPNGGKINDKPYFRWNDILREFGPEEFPITAV